MGDKNDFYRALARKEASRQEAITDAIENERRVLPSEYYPVWRGHYRSMELALGRYIWANRRAQIVAYLKKCGIAAPT